ncbi:MAG TPA: hypothetical protein VKV26_22880 [Dehalococcoidia bacterium]|nr:hypothetical protein [Dehalococcoidia bacterium]
MRRAALSRLRWLLPTAASLVLIAACASSGEAKPISIAQPLPDQESLQYNLLDHNGGALGAATVSIQRQGATLTLSQLYTDLSGHSDSLTTTADAATLLPRTAERSFDTGGAQAMLKLQYAAGQVTANVTSGGKTHHAAEKITTDSTYDDQESFFLLRTLPFSAGYSTQFVLVVTDAKSGTISRALATARVVGMTTAKVGGQNPPAWEVQLSAAGATTTAWFDTSPLRRLLRYDNSGQTRIELKSP